MHQPTNQQTNPNPPHQTQQTYTIWGHPRPQGSKTAYRKNGKTILTETSKHNKQWRKTTQQQLQQQNPHKHPPHTPLKITLTYHMPRPKTHKNKPSPPMTQRPDLDKLTRSTLDACTGTLYHDDSQITTIHAHKKRTTPNTPPHLTITIQPDEE